MDEERKAAVQAARSAYPPGSRFWTAEDLRGALTDHRAENPGSVYRAVRDPRGRLLGFRCESVGTVVYFMLGLGAVRSNPEEWMKTPEAHEAAAARFSTGGVL